ncbi:MAG: FAD-dependent oxidoreductase [Bradymonadaceae bacterium]|nr:FAD-dependent oxidoreductase [Lujinxingiaceae bacterium]
MRKIVVLGCGFAGYNTALQLEEGLGGRRRVQLTIVTDKAHFLFTPLLYGVATGELDMTHVAVGLTDQFASTTQLVIDPVRSIDLARRVIICEQEEVAFDYLVVAPGSVVDWGGHENWKNFAHTFKDARDGVLVRERLTQAFAQAARLSDPGAIRAKVSFVIVGAGATGVELAAELYSSIRADLLPQASAQVRELFRFVLVEAADKLLPQMPDELRAVAQPYLESIGVELRLAERVVEIAPSRVMLESGEAIEADNIFWCGGVRAPAFLAEAGFETDANGRVLVEKTLRARGHQGIYVTGDAAAGDPLLAQDAHVAAQQAQLAAQNLLADLAGRSKRPIEFEYRGNLVTLGRGNAVVTMRNKAIEGKAAWLMYRLFYTAMMPHNLKKARLLKDWVASRSHRSEGLPASRLLEDSGPAKLADDL